MDTEDIYPGLVGVGYTEDDLYYWGWWNENKRFQTIDSDGSVGQVLSAHLLMGFDKAHA